jgi:hypothetical protein
VPKVRWCSVAQSRRGGGGGAVVRPGRGGGGGDSSLLGDYTAKVYSAADAKAFINRLSDVQDPNDPGLVPSARAFGEITKLLNANLKAVQVVKVGPKDANGKLADDQGLYSYVVIGRASDGKVAGIMLGSVET